MALNINELLQKEVSRKEFLRYAGVAFLGLVGVSRMLDGLQKSLVPTQVENKKPSGYGMSPYGK